MYKSLVIGMSFMIESCSSCKTFFLQTLLIIRGSMNNTLQQSRDFSMYSEEAWTERYTLAYTKGKLFQRFQQVLKGSMGNRIFL